MTLPMDGKFTRAINFERDEDWRSLKHVIFNFFAIYNAPTRQPRWLFFCTETQTTETFSICSQCISDVQPFSSGLFMGSELLRSAHFRGSLKSIHGPLTGNLSSD